MARWRARYAVIDYAMLMQLIIVIDEREMLLMSARYYATR